MPKTEKQGPGRRNNAASRDGGLAVREAAGRVPVASAARWDMGSAELESDT